MQDSIQTRWLRVTGSIVLRTDSPTDASVADRYFGSTAHLPREFRPSNAKLEADIHTLDSV